MGRQVTTRKAIRAADAMAKSLRVELRQDTGILLRRSLHPNGKSIIYTVVAYAPDRKVKERVFYVGTANTFTAERFHEKLALARATRDKMVQDHLQAIEERSYFHRSRLGSEGARRRTPSVARDHAVNVIRSLLIEYAGVSTRAARQKAEKLLSAG